MTNCEKVAVDPKDNDAIEQIMEVSIEAQYQGMKGERGGIFHSQIPSPKKLFALSSVRCIISWVFCPL